MSTSGISRSDLSSIHEQFKQFRKGAIQLQKSDLTSLKETLAGSDPAAGTGIDSLLASFDQIDQNQDGISFPELVAFNRAKGGNQAAESGEPPQSDGPQRRGRPGHGRGSLPPVSVDDLQAYKANLEEEGKEVPPELTELINGFAAIDKDGSGKVSFDEVRDYLKKTAPQGIAPSTGLTKDELAELKDRLAQNGEQAVDSLQKVIGGFDQADANGDGKVDLAELQNFLQGSGIALPDGAKPPALSGSELATQASLESGSPSTPTRSGDGRPSPLFLQRLVHGYGMRVQASGGTTLEISA